MKNSIILLALIALSGLGNAKAYYEDVPKVRELAEAGTPEYEYRYEQCPQRYSVNKDLKDAIVTYENVFCVDRISLPTDVLAEVLEMKDNELENDSDYDSRITRFFVFKNDDFRALQGMPLKTIKEFAKGLGIPANQLKHDNLSTFTGDHNSFSQLEGLAMGFDYVEESLTLKHLRSLINGKTVTQVSFSDGIELYPGGGLGVTHYLLFIGEKTIYIKHSHWDA